MGTPEACTELIFVERSDTYEIRVRHTALGFSKCTSRGIRIRNNLVGSIAESLPSEQPFSKIDQDRVPNMLRQKRPQGRGSGWRAWRWLREFSVVNRNIVLDLLDQMLESRGEPRIEERPESCESKTESSHHSCRDNRRNRPRRAFLQEGFARQSFFSQLSKPDATSK